MSNNKSFLGEIWALLKERKAWWLAPVIILLLIVGVLIVFGQSSALSPFIYALFWKAFYTSSANKVCEYDALPINSL